MPANLPLLDLSAALLACAILLGLWGSRLDRTRALLGLGVPILLGASLWVPVPYRIHAFAAFVVLALLLAESGPIWRRLPFAFGLGFVVVTVGVLLGFIFGQLFLLYAVVVLTGLALGADARGALRQLSRRAGRPGETTLGGVAFAPAPITPPGIELPCLLYGANPWKLKQVASDAPFALRTSEGIARVEPAGAELELSTRRPLSVAEGRALLGSPLKLPTFERPGALHYLAPGSACFVTGVPTLEPLPPELAEGGQGGAYRAGVERVPVFRVREGRLVISDRAEDTRRHETRIRARFDLCTGTIVALLALALVALQALHHWKVLPRG